MSLCPFLAVRLRLKLANPPLDVKPVSSDAVRASNGGPGINPLQRGVESVRNRVPAILLGSQLKKNHNKGRNLNQKSTGWQMVRMPRLQPLSSPSPIYEFR